MKLAHIYIAFLTHVSSVLITFVTLAVFIGMEGGNGDNSQFTAGRVFAALALFNQMTVPLFIFPITVPIIIAAIISTRRLEEFLDQPEVQRQFEGIRNMARILSRSDASLDVFEKEEKQQRESVFLESDENSSQVFDIPEKVEIVAAAVANDEAKVAAKCLTTKVKLRKNNQLSQSTKLDRNRLRQKSSSKEFQLELPANLVAQVRTAVFARQKSDDANVLRIDKLDIPKGENGFFEFLGGFIFK